MSDGKEYNKHKMDIIRTYADGDIINMINYIKDHDALKNIRKALDIYVPFILKKSNNNSKKYGLETKQAFVDGLKGCPKEVRKDKINSFQELSEKIYTVFFKLYIEELFSDIEDLDDFSAEDIFGEESLNILIEINNKKHCPKEYIENWYKYNPYIDENVEIEQKIRNLTFSFADMEKNKQLNEIKNLKIQLKEIKTENEILKKENEDLDDKLTSYTSDILDFEAKCENMDNKIKDLEIENDNLKYNKYAVERDYNNLLKKYEELSNKKSFSGDVEKMKNHFEEQLIEKDNIIRELKKDKEELIESNKEIISLQNENSKLKRRETGIIRDLKSLILGNKDFQKKFKRIILEDKPICEFIVRNIPDLKSGVEQEVASRREQREIERERKKVITRNLSNNNIVEKIKVNYNDLKTHYEKFCTNNGIIPISDLWNKIQSETFFIFEEDSLIKLLKNSNYDIDIKRISIEPNWHEMEDWFGKFDDGVFIPSKTDIADFYIDKKENPNKLGILVFDNFNIIPPEIYIKYFIEDIENNGEFWVVDINTPIVEGYEFMSVEHLSNLKYFFIKSKDPDTSFKIPKDLLKYELTGVN